MLCSRCEGQAWDGRTTQPSARRSRIPTCDRCGATILTLKGVAVGIGDEVLAQLGRFGLAVTGEPLLERRREGI